METRKLRLVSVQEIKSGLVYYSDLENKYVETNKVVLNMSSSFTYIIY